MFYEREPKRLDAINKLVGGGLSGRTDGVDIDYKDKTPPSESAIDTKLAELQTEYDAQEYARKRQTEFPSIQDLVVALYDTDDKADIEAKRAAVKAKYPKP